MRGNIIYKNAIDQEIVFLHFKGQTPIKKITDYNILEENIYFSLFIVIENYIFVEAKPIYYVGSTSKNLYLLNDVSSVVFRKNIINSSSLEIDLIVLKKVAC